ncbi:MAG: DUF3109 family protein [Ignavibacteria bacterium]|nr:MAG: DUF3109 family protein [Ignavibacteria bacterium]
MNFNLSETGSILVNNEILKAKFTCDLQKCKGACCTMESEYGAPVTENEIEIIKKNLDIIYKYLPAKNVDIIKKSGFSETKEGELLIKSIENRDCVFVYYENDIAKCGIEKAYLNKELDFQKPISCHLFPIRVADFGGPVLRYEKYNECLPAVELGKQTQLTVAEFCKDALIRAYGQEWYDELITGLEK